MAYDTSSGEDSDFTSDRPLFDCIKCQHVSGVLFISFGLVLLVAGVVSLPRNLAIAPSARIVPTFRKVIEAQDASSAVGWWSTEMGSPGALNAAGYWSSGYHHYMTVYHQTSPEICSAIMETNFRIGKGGLCGKAIYFALSPEVTSTKAITANSHGGCMIEAIVDVGKQDRYYWTGKAHRGEKYCGGWNQMTGEKLHTTGVDSIMMRQTDGDEVVVFEPERIVSKKILAFNCKWMCKGACQKHWPSNCHHYH